MTLKKDRTPLTKTAIDKLTWNDDGPSVQIKWDTLPGFGIRVFESGAKSFIIQYRDESGMDRRYTVGVFGKLTLVQARKHATQLFGKIAAGVDPLKEKQAKRDQHRAARDAMTVADFVPIYIERAKTVGNPGRKTRRPKKTWKEDQRRLTKYVLASKALSSRALAAVTKDDIIKLHTTISRTAPVEANRVLALFSVMISAAIELGHLPESHVNPTSKVPPNEEQSCDRWVEPSELPAFWAAVHAEESAYVKAFFILTLLLGTRRSELLHAKWEDVNLARNILRLPNTKAGNIHLLPLSPQAVAILRDLPRAVRNPHVFPSPVEPGAPMADLKRQWKRIRERTTVTLWTQDENNADRVAALRAQAERDSARQDAEESVDERFHTLVLREVERTGARTFMDVTIHDLRRTVGSWLVTNGASLPLIGKVLNHADPSTTEIYARFAEDATRVTLQEHADRLFAVATGTAPAVAPVVAVGA